MTPQEKAKQLVDQYMDLSEEQDKTLIKYLEKLSSNSYNTPRYMSKDMAVKCALIAVDEIINSNPYKLSLEGEFLTEHMTYDINFWEEVKKEIEKA